MKSDMKVFPFSVVEQNKKPYIQVTVKDKVKVTIVVLIEKEDAASVQVCLKAICPNARCGSIATRITVDSRFC